MEPVYSREIATGYHLVRTKAGGFITYDLCGKEWLKLVYTSKLGKEEVAELIQFLQTIHNHMKG